MIEVYSQMMWPILNMAPVFEAKRISVAYSLLYTFDGSGITGITFREKLYIPKP